MCAAQLIIKRAPLVTLGRNDACYSKNSSVIIGKSLVAVTRDWTVVIVISFFEGVVEFLNELNALKNELNFEDALFQLERIHLDLSGSQYIR